LLEEIYGFAPVVVRDELIIQMALLITVLASPPGVQQERPCGPCRGRAYALSRGGGL